MFVSEYEKENHHKVFGVYLGTISNRDDPQKRGRVRLRIPDMFIREEHPSWALPMGVNYGPEAGRLIVPPLGTMVFVFFLEGNPDIPVWCPGPFNQNERPATVRNQPDHVYPNELVLHQTFAGTSVVENAQGDVDVNLAPQRALRIEGTETYLFLDVAPHGKIEINRPEEEQRAARKGDAVRVVIPAGTVVVNVVSGAPVLNALDIELEGIITTGSSVVKIGGGRV